jgi:hypothetical protein
VEARYKGKGTRWYPGKVASVTVAADGAVTYALAYDDGDSEPAARPEHVRRVGVSKADAEQAAPAPSPAPVGPISGQPAVTADVSEAARPFVVGDKVEARYKGKGTRWYPGKIAAVRRTGGMVVFDIAYDDGDSEQGATAANIRHTAPLEITPIAAERDPFTDTNASFASLNASAKSRLSVTFSDDHELDLERSHDEPATRYAPQKPTSGSASAAGARRGMVPLRSGTNSGSASGASTMQPFGAGGGRAGSRASAGMHAIAEDADEGIVGPGRRGTGAALGASIGSGATKPPKVDEADIEEEDSVYDEASFDSLTHSGGGGGGRAVEAKSTT